MYLGPKIGLAPRDDRARFRANGLQLKITDLVAEAHHTDHPTASGDYYEDQKEAVLARSADFITSRLPKFLDTTSVCCRRTSTATPIAWAPR